MKRSLKIQTAALTALALVTLVASGCGSSGGASGSPGGSPTGSTYNGAQVIPTPYGNALSYSFTATSTQPSGPLTGGQTRRFVAGSFPNVPQGTCGYPTFDTSYFCNNRDYPRGGAIRTTFFDLPVLGGTFGSIVASVAPGITSGGYTSGSATRGITGYYSYDQISQVSLTATTQTGVPCPAVYANQGFSLPTSCSNVSVSGVIMLSPQFVSENLSTPTISNIALDIDVTSFAGTIFVMYQPGHGTVINF